jgi:hypothetical protein
MASIGQKVKIICSKAREVISDKNCVFKREAVKKNLVLSIHICRVDERTA